MAERHVEQEKELPRDDSRGEDMPIEDGLAEETLPGDGMPVTLESQARKRIALVAHDSKKADLLEWACYNRDLLVQHELIATGTTGHLLSEQLDAPITCLQSGPLGGDQQIGARIAEGSIDLLIFFWDPLLTQPHDPDVKALLRIAVVWNIPVACDRATADYLISSPLMTGAYERLLPDYTAHIERLFEPQETPMMLDD